MRFEEYKFLINPEFLPPEFLVLAVEPLLPDKLPNTKGGRPRVPNWKMFIAIFYVLRSGIQWKALPKCLGAASTVHDRFQQWAQMGIFRTLWEMGLLQAYLDNRLDFEWITMDGCATKSPLGGEKTGANPTDRGKCGTKRHLMTEAQGLPISLQVTGANTHDITQVEALFDDLAIVLPLDEEHCSHVCADKAYDSVGVRKIIRQNGCLDNIKSRGEEKTLLKVPGFRARRWVNERTHSWMNRFRRILIRWEKKIDNYLAFLHLCCASIVWKHCRVFG